MAATHLSRLGDEYDHLPPLTLAQTTARADAIAHRRYDEGQIEDLFRSPFGPWWVTLSLGDSLRTSLKLPAACDPRRGSVVRVYVQGGRVVGLDLDGIPVAFDLEGVATGVSHRN